MAAKSNQPVHPIQPLDPGESRKRRREGALIALLGLLFAGLTLLEFRLTQASSALPFVNSIFFFGLLNINIILLIALVWLVFRNIGKLFIERRRQILGARLKTKLVIAFLGFSIIPTLVLFVISALYINSSFDKWFSVKIQNTLQASLEVTDTYYRNTKGTALHFAEHLARGVGRRLPARSGADETGWGGTSPPWLEEYLESQRDLLALDAVEFYADPLDQRVVTQRAPVNDVLTSYPRLPLDLLTKAFHGEPTPVLQSIGTGDLIRCMAPVHAGGEPSQPIVGVVVVNAYIPVSLVNKVDEIASVFDDYKFTNPLKYPMKTTYLVILILITLVILFVAIWIGLYMARELTVPVARLVHGAQAVGAGNLNITIPAVGHDEIGILIDSFNKMTRDLREKQARLTQAGADLENRRLQLEAVLANIGTGVVSISNEGEVTTFNRALASLLATAPEAAVGRGFREVFGSTAQPLVELIERALSHSQQEGYAAPETAQWNTGSGEGYKALAAVATSLVASTDQGGTRWGVVAVVDDITHLIKGQREMAWREVARRIAHEIKNPLTPIKLSAQRLQRRLGGAAGEEGALLQECTDTIIKHTDELKEMVNEFSNFARLPEANPVPNDLNEALSEVISLFRQAHPQIRIDAHLGELPTVEFDRDQIKRVFINLLDNAVAALSSVPDGTERRIELGTRFNENLRMAVIRVYDFGPGMSPEVLERVFEPYFSTKSEGTGLGLAIAKRIVNDHDGFIRVHSAPGEGTEFLIELPGTRRPRMR